MKILVLTASFKRSFKALIRRDPLMETKIAERLRLLVSDPFHPSLKTHKLKGKLAGAWSCSVEYDCRIIFNFKESSNPDQEEILLIDIGSHDDVY